MDVFGVSFRWSIPLSVSEGTVVKKVLAVALPILFLIPVMFSSAKREEELVVFMIMAMTATVIMISSLFENTKERILYRDPWPSSNRLYGPGWRWDPFFDPMNRRYVPCPSSVNRTDSFDGDRHVIPGRDK